MSKIVKILRELGEALVMLILIIVAAVILTALAIPACIVFLIVEVVGTFTEAVGTFIERKYEEHKKSNSADLCDKESTEDSASSSDAARDTAGAESAGNDKEF